MKAQQKYHLMVIAYFIDFLVKVYLIYKVGGMQLAYCGAMVDLCAKAFHIRTTQFRKPKSKRGKK